MVKFENKEDVFPIHTGKLVSIANVSDHMVAFTFLSLLMTFPLVAVTFVSHWRLQWRSLYT